jgi:hypothetical protein
MIVVHKHTHTDTVVETIRAPRRARCGVGLLDSGLGFPGVHELMADLKI